MAILQVRRRTFGACALWLIAVALLASAACGPAQGGDEGGGSLDVSLVNTEAPEGNEYAKSVIYVAAAGEPDYPNTLRLTITNTSAEDVQLTLEQGNSAFTLDFSALLAADAVKMIRFKVLEPGTGWEHGPVEGDSGQYQYRLTYVGKTRQWKASQPLVMTLEKKESSPVRS